MFQGGDCELRAIAAHNSHENVSLIQEGGTVLVAYGTLIDYLHYCKKDETGLGRWTVMTLRGSEEITATREGYLLLQPMLQQQT